MGLPRTLPPKSSTAICAAVTEPWPVGVDAGPFMSVSTPILTTSSEIWARADGDVSIAAASAASAIAPLAESNSILPLTIIPLRIHAAHEQQRLVRPHARQTAPASFCAVNSGAASTD